MSSLSAPYRPTVPTPLTSLVGRERELDTLTRLLSQGDPRLLTLTGPGGVGKTRLAIGVASSLGDSFAGRIWFVPLAALDDPSLVLPAIAQALGVRASGRHVLLDEISRALGNEPALLVLDNFEQIIEAAPMVVALLTRCPRLTCLVTSRSVLRLSGEHVFPVPALPLPPAAHASSLARAAASPAVQLFVRRAQAAQPEFALTEANAADIEAICRKLDGLPLAIELAAARVRHFAPPELLARLNATGEAAMLRVLTGGPRDAPARQQALRHAISWSYDLLSPQEQALFRRLAVFVGGFTLTAAQAVAADLFDASHDVADGIASLLDQSLIQSLGSTPGCTRFGLLETIREFALERLATDPERLNAQDAHAAWFAALAQRAITAPASNEQPASLSHLQVEHANLRAALTHAEQQGDLTRGLGIAASLWRFWHLHGHWREGYTWLVRLLEQAPTGDGIAPATWAMAQAGAGWLAHYQNDHIRAEQALAQAAEAYQRLGLTAGLVDVRNCQSLVAQSLGEHRRSVEHGAAALELARTLDDPGLIAESLSGLSRATRELGDYPHAAHLAQEILSLCPDSASRLRAGALLTLGDIARDLGDSAAIREHCTTGVAIFRALGEPLGEGFALHNLAVAALIDGDLPRAAALCQESLAIFRHGDVQGAITEVMATYGPVLHESGDHLAAQATLLAALRLSHQVGPRWVAAAVLEALACLDLEPRAAVSLISQASAIRARLEVPVRPNWQPRLDRALAHLQAALTPGGFAAAWRHGKQLDLGSLATQADLTSLVRLAASQDHAAAAAPREPATPARRENPHGLTEREVEVLRLITGGHSNREMGERLFISPATAARHVANIYNKLGVDSRARATAFAFQHGLA
ncbi:MAG: LuxR C-terminal-related transcriptional regulator [Thermomicrobiales bacterium]